MANGGLLGQIASGGSNIPQGISQGYLSGLQFQQEQQLGNLEQQALQQDMMQQQQQMDIAASQAARERIQTLREDEVQELENSLRMLGPAVDYLNSTGDTIGANARYQQGLYRLKNMGVDTSDLPPVITPETLPTLDNMRQMAVYTVDTYREMAKEKGGAGDSFTRAIDLRNKLTQQLRDNPGDKQLRKDLEAVNNRIEKLTAVTGRTPQDITANRRDEISAQADQLDQTVDLLNNLAEQYEANPNAAGAVGSLKETLGGLAEQFMGEPGEQISAYLGTEKARKIRTKTRLALGRLLPVITGDTSGRYTDKEKEFAEETLGGLDKLSSDKAVATALREIIGVVENSHQRMQRRMGKTLPASGGQSSPPEQAIEYLRNNPETSSQFDEIFGEGASQQYLGE